MILISLGTNLGNRLKNLQLAVEQIKKRCLYNIKLSIVIETEALLLPGSPSDWNIPYLNMIVSGETHLSPEDLLKELKTIELELGRPKEYPKWAPRIIDLDILKYNDISLHTENLTLPHPGLKDRDFLKHLLALMGDYSQDPKELQDNIFQKSFVIAPQIVGVVNTTNDSFSDGGEFYNIENALRQIQSLYEQGASIVEIGAQSTRPGAILQSAEEEQKRLKSVLNALYIDAPADILISIDTYHPQIARTLLNNYPIFMINDVGGNYDQETLRFIADSGSKFCLMHSLSIPPQKDKVIPLEQSPSKFIAEWGKRSLDKLLSLGFKMNNIVLDPGIGFGKTAYQSLEILKNIEELKSLDASIMLGHSRKSYINSFASHLIPAQRDIETIAISLALQNKVDYLRVHNVKDHMRSLVAQAVLN